MITANGGRKLTKSLSLAWPISGLLAGLISAAFFSSSVVIRLEAGIVVLVVLPVVVLVFSGPPGGARIMSFIAGAALAVPCFLPASPLMRGLVACLLAIPFVIAAALVIALPMPAFRRRLAYICTWCGTEEVVRCKRGAGVTAIRDLLLATVALCVAFAGVNAASASVPGFALRWIAGGIAILALAEIASAGLLIVAAMFGVTVPSLFRSPCRSNSVGQFWTRRWNVAASHLFRWCCFVPLARRGVGFALVATFLVSAAAHAALAYVILGTWGIALSCGAFFMMQPLLIVAERRMKVRRWQSAAGRAWTLAALAVTSPLFVEPAMQILERSWGAPDTVLPGTLAALVAIIGASCVVALASTLSLPTETVTVSSGAIDCRPPCV